MFDFIDKNLILASLKEKQKNFIDLLLKKDIHDTHDFESYEDFHQCVELLTTLGLHYGHYIRRRKCANKFIKGTEYLVSLIDMKVSYSNFLNSLIKLFHQIVNNKNVLFISKKKFSFLKNYSFPNVCSIKKWIGGTLTNSKYVLGCYKCKVYESSAGYISMIYLLNPDNSFVTSKEVANYNEKREFVKGKPTVSLYLISDTDMRFTYDHSIIPILLNDESPYFRSFVNYSISQILEISKK